MRTTIRLPDDLLTAAKARAVATGQTLDEVIADALRAELAEEPHRGAAPPTADAGVHQVEPIDPPRAGVRPVQDSSARSSFWLVASTNERAAGAR